MEKFTKIKDLDNYGKEEDITLSDIEIEQVVDIFIPKTKEEEDEFLSKNENMVHFQTDSTAKEVKRGDTIYLTALIRKPGTTSFNSPMIKGVLKVRVVEIYQGLSKLNSLLNKK